MGTLLNGIKEIFATSQSTATHLPVCASDGTPQGRISVGDLASVLGGLNISMLGLRDETFLLSSADIPAGVYRNVDSASRPSGADESGFVLLIRSRRDENYFRCAYYFECGSVSETQRRVYINVYRSGWSEWKEISTNIPSFYKNYANLSSLASALGGLIPTAGKGDLNDYTNTSVSFLYNTQQLNKPADVTGGILITIVVDENMAIQILANYDSGIIYYRVKWLSVWKAWTKLSATVTT